MDRLTSGICVLSLDPKHARHLARKFVDRQMRKVYVARVRGVFPAEEELTVEQPIQGAHYRIGLFMVGPQGKPSKTVFRRLSTDGKTSVVECK